MESHQIHGMSNEQKLDDPFTWQIEEFICNKGMDGTTFAKLKEAYPSAEVETLEQILKELADKNYIVKLKFDGPKIYVYVSVMWVTLAQMKNISQDDNLF